MAGFYISESENSFLVYCGADFLPLCLLDLRIGVCYDLKELLQ